jgi:NADH-quinone oxidoreductase subunit J
VNAPDIAFWVITVVMGVAAIRVVTSKNVVHAALYLMIVLAGTAAIFILLGAEFLGWTQVLIYIGAIVVLFMFGVMLTKADLGKAGDLDNDQRVLAAVVAILVLGVLAGVIADAFSGERIVLNAPTTTATIGDELFANWVLPFEAVSVVLLAALIGSVVLARRDDPEHVTPRAQQQREVGVRAREENC